jgi:hypothetical protein
LAIREKRRIGAAGRQTCKKRENDGFAQAAARRFSFFVGREKQLKASVGEKRFSSGVRLVN